MPMRFPPFAAPLLFFGYIFLEIAVFILVGRHIGILSTLGLVLISSLCGAALLRRQGARLFAHIRQSVRAGALREREAGCRLIRCFAAILLIIPGLISSCLGLILLLPPLQFGLIRSLGGRLRYASDARFTHSSGRARQAERSRRAKQEPPILDLEPDKYHARDPENSPWRKP